MARRLRHRSWPSRCQSSRSGDPGWPGSSSNLALITVLDSKSPVSECQKSAWQLLQAPMRSVAAPDTSAVRYMPWPPSSRLPNFAVGLIRWQSTHESGALEIPQVRRTGFHRRSAIVPMVHPHQKLRLRPVVRAVAGSPGFRESRVASEALGVRKCCCAGPRLVTGHAEIAGASIIRSGRVDQGFAAGFPEAEVFRIMRLMAGEALRRGGQRICFAGVCRRVGEVVHKALMRVAFVAARARLRIHRKSRRCCLQIHRSERRWE